MRAARYYGVEDVRIEQIPDPSPGPGQVKVKVAHNGVCGSDLHEFYTAPTFIPTEPHPLTGAQIPCVLGHEFSGTVVEVGPEVTRVVAGDRVAVRPTYSCGKCHACTSSASNICEILAFHGGSAHGGGLSEFTVVEQGMVHRLPDTVSLELGALVEPMAVALHAVNRVDLAPDDTVVILGAGPIGIGVWFALRARGIDRVVISEPSADRRAAISHLGAGNTIDPTSDDLGRAVDRLSTGRGAAVVFDAAGVAPAFAQGLSVLAPHGTMMVIAVYQSALDFHPAQLLGGEYTVTASMTYTDDEFGEVIENMGKGLYSAEGWVEHRSIDALTGAFDDLRAGRAMKLLIDL